MLICAIYALELIVLRSGELLVADEAVLVFVLMLEDLLNQLVVTLKHLPDFIGHLTTFRGNHLLLQVIADLGQTEEPFNIG